MAGFWFGFTMLPDFQAIQQKSHPQLLQSSFRTPRWCWPREGLMVLHGAWSRGTSRNIRVLSRRFSPTLLVELVDLNLGWMNQRNWRVKMTKYMKPTTQSVVFFSPLLYPWEHDKGSPYSWGYSPSWLPWWPVAPMGRPRLISSAMGADV